MLMLRLFLLQLQQLKLEMMQKQQGARPKDGGPAVSQGYNKGQGQGQDEGQGPYQSNKKSKKGVAMYETEQQHLQRPYQGQFVRQNSNRFELFKYC